MSAETMEWLNTMTLVGFTDKRGKAWHYRKETQGNEDNHYPMAIPVEDVTRRLFNFTVEESPLFVKIDGEFGAEYVELVDRKAMVTSDTGDVLGLFKSGYVGHDYNKWLIDTVATILDDELAIGSAGLLRNRAQAWVSVEVPENITTPEGVEFRPNLIATTSFDGSLATTFKRVVQNVVCDNTLAAGLSEAGQQFKAKHTRHSGLKIANARQALEIVHTISDDFAAEVAKLCNTAVTDAQWSSVRDNLTPVPEDGNKRGVTVATDKRLKLDNLYDYDARVAPWKGTAFGVLQAFNTYNHHSAQVRKGVHRAQRNLENVVNGKTEANDLMVVAEVERVLTGASS